MSYATPEDVSIITGEPYDGSQQDYLEWWLEVIDDIVDSLIESYNVDPSTVTERKKKRVATLMGAQAAYCYQIDPTITSQSLTSGDTSESESRLASNAAYSRISRVEPIYLTILGLRALQIASAPVVNSWPPSYRDDKPYWR